MLHQTVQQGREMPGITGTDFKCMDPCRPPPCIPLKLGPRATTQLAAKMPQWR